MVIRNIASTWLSSSGGVVSPLAGRRSPTDDVWGLGIDDFEGFGSFNQLAGGHKSGIANCVGSDRYFIFGCIRKGGVFGLRIAAIFLLFNGTFV
ncbi:MAG: hypothetical protein ACK5M3_06820 [Dysgonomonas sp.]